MDPAFLTGAPDYTICERSLVRDTRYSWTLPRRGRASRRAAGRWSSTTAASRRSTSRRTPSRRAEAAGLAFLPLSSRRSFRAICPHGRARLRGASATAARHTERTYESPFLGRPKAAVPLRDSGFQESSVPETEKFVLFYTSSTRGHRRQKFASRVQNGPLRPYPTSARDGL